MAMESFLSLFGPSESENKPPNRKSLGNGKENEASFTFSSLCVDGDDSEEVMIKNLPPEPQVGNIEYKLKLLNPTSQRFEHLVSQMKWRLMEGSGESIYMIGVEDSGFLRGLSQEEMTMSLATLSRMAVKLGATMTVLNNLPVPGSSDKGKTVAEVLIRKICNTQPRTEMRIAVMGNYDTGKSTLLGVLTQGELDDGRGRARLNMFRHLHEIQSGRTSSISHEVLGFDSQGKTINYQEGSSETICELSTKLVTLIDLAGHHKYLRTTIGGITGYSPHYIFFIISKATGFTKMTKEHLSLALALEVPLVLVITKIDVISGPKLEDTLTELQNHMVSVGYDGVVPIHTEAEVLDLTSNEMKERVLPLFCVSCVTGEGLHVLTKLLEVLPPGLSSKDEELLEQGLPEFQIDETFRIPYVGTILGGLLTQGTLTEGTSLLLGPLGDGSFKPVSVTSIRRHKIPCQVLQARQSASIGLNIQMDSKLVRKGMVLLSPTFTPTSCLYFQASIAVLYHATAISKGFQTTVHIGNVRQTAIIEEIFVASQLATDDRASVIFRFIQHPEYIKIGSRLIFREGKTKGFGTVTHLFPLGPIGY